MSNQFNKQLIEDFFHSRLKHHKDDPGAEVWNEIRQNMPQKPILKRIPKVAYLIFTLLLLILLPLSYYMLTSTPKEEVLTEETSMAEKQVSIDAALSHLPQKRNKQLSEPSVDQKWSDQSGKKINQKPVAVVVKTAEKISKAKNDKPKSVKKEVATIIDQEKPVLETKKEVVKSAEATIKEILINYYKELNNTAMPGDKLRRVVAPLEAKAMPEICSHNVKAVQLPEIDIQHVFPRAEILEIATEEEKKNSIVYPHFRYGASIEPMSIIHGMAAPDQVTINDRITNAGISAGIQLNKNLSIISGLRFRYHDINIEGTVDLTYSAENMQIDDQGNQAGDYNIQPRSNSFINVNSSIVNEVQNDGNDIENGDHFGVDISGTYRLKYHSIPVWLNYEFGANRLFFNLKGGIQFHSLIGNKIKDVSASVFDLVSNGATNRLMVDDASIQVETRKDHFIEAGLGLGLNYALTNAINLGIEPRLYKAITAIFDNKPWGVGVNAGISIRIDPKR